MEDKPTVVSESLLFFILEISDLVIFYVTIQLGFVLKGLHALELFVGICFGKNEIKSHALSIVLLR